MSGTRFKITNTFNSKSEEELKKGVNNAVKTLCSVDVEKRHNLDYNINTVFPSDKFYGI